jgi:hypothetical protein
MLSSVCSARQIPSCNLHVALEYGRLDQPDARHDLDQEPAEIIPGKDVGAIDVAELDDHLFAEVRHALQIDRDDLEGAQERDRLMPGAGGVRRSAERFVLDDGLEVVDVVVAVHDLRQPCFVRLGKVSAGALQLLLDLDDQKAEVLLDAFMRSHRFDSLGGRATGSAGCAPSAASEPGLSGDDSCKEFMAS